MVGVFPGALKQWEEVWASLQLWCSAPPALQHFLSDRNVRLQWRIWRPLGLTKVSLPPSVSKQPALMPGQSYGLEDGSSSYKDFSESRNNRFSTPEQAAKNRIQHPSNVLHFFNAPLEVTEENFFEVGHHSHLSGPFILFWPCNKYLLISAGPCVGCWGQHHTSSISSGVCQSLNIFCKLRCLYFSWGRFSLSRC